MPQATIAITGAGSGLGEAIARHFAGRDYAVAVTDLLPARAERVAAEIEAAGGSALAQGLDVTSSQDWDALYQRVLTEWGRLDVLVNNAGVAAAGRLEDSSIEDWRWVLDTNLLGVVRGCHRFLPMMREQRHGHIVNVASFAGMVPVPELSAYVTAKSAVVALSDQLRVDLAASGVSVSLLCPAFVQTRLLETFRSRDQRHRRQAEKWMADARVTAEQVARDVFVAVRKQRYLLLTHRGSRWAWRFRRWFPERCHRAMVRLSNSSPRRSQR